MKKYFWKHFLVTSSAISALALSTSCSKSTQDTKKEPNPTPDTDKQTGDSNKQTGDSGSNNSHTGGSSNEGSLEDVQTEFAKPNSGNGTNLNIPGKPNISDAEYKALSTEQKNKVDLDAYINVLGAELTRRGIYNPNSLYSVINESDVNSYDQKASQADQPDYKSALLRNFTINKNGKLVPNPLGYKLSAAYWNSTVGNRGLARFLPNEKYRDIALQSFAIALTNQNDLISTNDSLTERGTAWIIDYELNDNGYPTKWYLATNLHVAEALRKTTSDGVYSNVVDLQKEKIEYDKTQKRLAELIEIHNKIAKPFDDRIAQSDAEIERLRTELRKEEVDGTPENVKRYEQLIKEQQELQGNINQEKFAKLEEDFNKQYLVEYNQLLQASVIKGITKKIVLEHFNDELPIKQELSTNAEDFRIETFELDPSQVKLVYGGIDFLKTSPKDYLENPNKYHNAEEIADFAVLEIDFNKPGKKLGYWSRKLSSFVETATASELAQRATSNFANWDASRKFKFASSSLYKDYEKNNQEKISVTLQDGRSVSIPKSNVNLMALGFPNSASDNQLDDLARFGKESILQNTSSIWVNKPIYLNPKKQASGRITTEEYGSGFSKSFGVRNFLSHPGISDYFITSPVIDAQNSLPFNAGNFKDSTSSYQGPWYFNYGLGYTLNSWQPLQGASGSSVRTIDNQIVGINFASNDKEGNSLTSLVQAFRSEGIDYKGAYGPYKLEQYDLIYGGGKNQRTSYRQALNQYKSNIKTYLFPNGTSDANVPEEYKFTK
ncbi:Ig-specific serine endopeptidase MIP [Mycoplasmopsis columboralis]|uniref:Membrane-associated lipoprotein n=1 Tax=Mycoplasmopsis columboralis TaxID=171282 RepID=A0A449B6E1_9BACT|nr:hypothetical protein [Mycoplasmopsis columboralis]VEU76149.1 Membrane-associated lipoprotein precursor [Mycoplasmopsis columboralis]